MRKMERKKSRVWKVSLNIKQLNGEGQREKKSRRRKEEWKKERRKERRVEERKKKGKKSEQEWLWIKSEEGKY